MRVWITGIAGFLGNHLAEALREKHIIGGNDNMLCSSSPLYSFDKIDCCDFKSMEAVLYGFNPDVLIHCAATAHEGLSNFSPSFITRNIYEASVATFSAAIAAGVQRIIFMSSMARYGNGYWEERGEDWRYSPFNEGYQTNPIDPYGIAKVAAEQTLIALCKLHNVEYLIAVPHNIIGPLQKYDDPFRNVASIMINRALQDKPILIYGDGQQKRCFSPIDDCLDSLVKMIDAPLYSEVINIGPDGGEITVLDLAEMIRDLTGGSVEIQHVPARPNEVKHAWCSSDKARKLLGYEAKKSLHECLSEMVEYIRENGIKDFKYSFPIEIEEGCPEVWLKKII